MTRLHYLLLIAPIIISLVSVFTPVAKTQISPLRTVWENPYTLTTYHPGSEVNSTFYTFPKVIWNGSQYADYIFNSSDMKAHRSTERGSGAMRKTDTFGEKRTLVAKNHVDFYRNNDKVWDHGVSLNLSRG